MLSQPISLYHSNYIIHSLISHHYTRIYPLHHTALGSFSPQPTAMLECDENLNIYDFHKSSPNSPNIAQILYKLTTITTTSV